MNSGNTSPQKVLVVEDEKVLLTLIKRLFSRGEFNVEISTAGTIREGLETINRDDLALLVTDMSLPDGRGAELIQSFRAKFATAPIIVMSGSITVESEVRAIPGGNVQTCLQKPFSVDDFHSAVAKALKS